MEKILLALMGAVLLSACSKPELSNLHKQKITMGAGQAEFYSELANTEKNPYRLRFINTSAGFVLNYNSGAAYQYPLSDAAILAELSKNTDGFINGGVQAKNGSFIPQKAVFFENVELTLNPEYNNYKAIVKDISAWQKKVIHFQRLEKDGTEHNVELYCPDRIVIFTPYAVPFSKKEPVEIRWNADRMNASGVVMKTEYKSAFGKEVDVFLLEDDGSFIIPPDYINKIPAGTDLEIQLNRGNVALITDKGSDSTQIILETSSMGIYKISD
jgi:hypothetical protein